MTDSNHPNSRPARAGESSEDPARDVPADLQDLDQALGRMLTPLADESPDGLSDRVFEASVQDLPTKVLPFGAATEAEPTRVRIPYLAYAALILVAVLSWVANMNQANDAIRDEEAWVCNMLNAKILASLKRAIKTAKIL